MKILQRLPKRYGAYALVVALVMVFGLGSQYQRGSSFLYQNCRRICYTDNVTYEMKQGFPVPYKRAEITKRQGVNMSTQFHDARAPINKAALVIDITTLLLFSSALFILLERIFLPKRP